MRTLETLLDLLGEELELAARPVDYGYDRTLIENNLRMTLEQRLDQAANFAEFIGQAQAQIRAQQAVRP